MFRNVSFIASSVTVHAIPNITSASKIYVETVTRMFNAGGGCAPGAAVVVEEEFVILHSL